MDTSAEFQDTTSHSLTCCTDLTLAMISPEVMKELLSVRQVLHYLPASPSTDKGWTVEESRRFWAALIQYPEGPWTAIAEFIGTKSTRQAMTHGQKLRQKLRRWNKRLRRNPAVGLLMDEISVSPNGHVSLGSLPLSDHPVLGMTATHPLYTREVGSASTVKVQSLSDAVVKQEELLFESASFSQDARGVIGVATASSSASSSVVPSGAAHLKTSDASVGLPPLYSSWGSPRPHLPVAVKSNVTMAITQLSLIEAEVLGEFTLAPWVQSQ